MDATPQQPPRMPLQQAMGIISDVCRRAQGDLDFHNAVQTALSTIGETLEVQATQIQQLLMQCPPEAAAQGAGDAPALKKPEAKKVDTVKVGTKKVPRS